jgi:YidC/Oxa1 family membrane protein insertase
MFTTIVIAPLYNALIYIVNVLPGHQLWISVMVLTVAFKIILIPFFKKQVRDQIVMNHIGPELKKLQEKYKDQREVLAKETMFIYSKYKVNPLISIFVLLIQLPFMFGLYKIFYHEIGYYQELLYTGLLIPNNIIHSFLGVDLTESKNIIFAILATVSQYILGAYMFKAQKQGSGNESEIVQAMNIQMKYFLPLVIGVASYATPTVIALYLIISNIFGIVQEILIKKPLTFKVEKELAESK